jgi:hypothetical protein
VHEPASQAKRRSSAKNWGSFTGDAERGKDRRYRGEACRVGKWEVRLEINQKSEHGGKSGMLHGDVRGRRGEEVKKSVLHGAVLQ